jgi:phage terminase large subunit-like protein
VLLLSDTLRAFDEPTLVSAIERGSLSLVQRAYAGADVVDPLQRLFDPTFTQTLWEYEFSRTEPDIPGQLHAKQVEAFVHNARHRWLFWGNQVGKTTVGAIDLVMLCLGRHPNQKWQPPVKCWASALTWELWENILLPELLTWIPVDRIVGLAPPANKKSTRRDILIRADNGKISRITGKAAEQGAERYQSARVHRVWLDEEHPESVWDEMQPRLLRFGGDTIATMTPLKGFTWVYGRVYEPFKTAKVPVERHWCSHAGLEDNPSVTPEALNELRQELKHNPAQLAARLSGHFVRPIGAVWPFDIELHGRVLTAEQLQALVAKGRHYGAIDLGKWRFWFGWGIVGVDGELTIVGEVFSQNEDIDVRARKIDELLTAHEAPESIQIRADNADPKMIEELNAALDRRGSKYFVSAVEAKHKIKNAGILRVESLLNRKALFVLRTPLRPPGDNGTWRLGMSASAPGKPVEGSRLIWEMNNWQYPKLADGKIQKDEPDDATADGADACDGVRYMVMTWLGPIELVHERKHPTPEQEIWKEALGQPDDEDDASAEGSEYGDVVQEG